MTNSVSTRSYLTTSTACLLAFASQVAAQNSETLEQRVAQLEQQLAAQGESGSSSNGSLYDLFKSGRADYQLGRGLTFSAQDEESFSVSLGGQVQIIYSYTDDDPSNTTTSGFGIRSSRVRLGGNVFSKDITYFIQMDPSATTDVVDAWAGWRVRPNMNIRVGHQKMRSSLQGDTSMADTDLELVDRSIATLAFAGHRVAGGLLEGSAAEGKFNYHVGLMNNGTGGLDAAGAVPGNAAGVLALAGTGAIANQAGENELGWTVGASYGSSAGNSEDWSEGDLARSGNLDWIGGVTITQVNENVAIGGDAMTVNAFGGVKVGNGLAAQFEYFMRDNDDINRDDSGFYGQVSYTLEKKGNVQWGGVFRYSMVDFDGPEATEITAGINAYYHEHNLKTQVQVRQLGFDNAAGVEVSDTLSLDLLFTLVF